MSNELSDPGEDLDCDGSDIRVVGVRGRGEVVGKCGPGDYEGEENAASYGLEQDVEAAVEDCCNGAGIEGEVRDREP